MKKLLKRLPLEGLLIIAVALLGIIIVLLFTKVETVISSNNNFVVNTIKSDDNNVLFIQDNKIPETVIAEEVKTNENENKEITPERRNVRLYYIKVSTDGEILAYSVSKPTNLGTTPLTKTIERLLEGPDTNDLNQGLLTLIPDGTKLLSISIKEEVAYLNFNDYFRFNPLGVEGYMAQIKQIVYTATEFPTVKAVQFLIDGSTQEYLGLEGVYIGRPITRSDFEL